MTSRPIKPLPCPVCGRKPTVQPSFSYTGPWAVECYLLRVLAEHLIVVRGKTEAASIKNWNRYVGRKK